MDAHQVFTYTKHLRIGSDILFMNNHNKEVIGKVCTVHHEQDEYRNCLWYSVDFEGKELEIDGETFRIMKKL